MSKLKNIDENELLQDEDIENALEPKTLLGREVIRQFKCAVAYKKSQRVGDYSLHELLVECFNARDDKTSCAEMEFKNKYPEWSSMPVSLVAFKVNILVALIRETLVDVAQAPFIIDPTPDPEIPQDKKDEIIDSLMEEVETITKQITLAQKEYIQAAIANGVDPNVAASQPDFPNLDPKLVLELTKQRKVQMFREIKEHAEEQALLLQRSLYDKTIEGGYRKAILEFADDFATYPFGCIHGPFPIVTEETRWDKNKYVEEEKVSWVFERVSPFDLFWTEDSTNTQNGTAVFIRKLVDYDYLYNCRKLARDDENSGYQYETINELIEMTKEGKIPRHWIEFDARNMEYKGQNLLWTRGNSAEIIIRYGKFSGYELNEMGFADIDDTKIYETKIIMCGGHIIYCAINKNPSKYKRPVFTASFEARNNSIVGVGLGQKLLSIHKAYRAMIHLMMYNMGLSSEPITEVETSRILQYMPQEWIESPVIAPGMVIPADGDRLSNGSRAIKFTQIPNTADSSLRVAAFILEQAHIISNIPAALHGQPVGSGANRTVRGLLTLQGNTLKPIQSALMNLDMGVIEPMVTLLYMLLVMYEDSFEYSGDCKVVAKGAASMVQREIEKQAAMENLQILGQLGQYINPDLLSRVVTKLLTVSGILEPGESPISPSSMQSLPSSQSSFATQPQPQPQPQEQSMPVQ